MNILTFTSLYPNAVKPSHGVFVENRLVHLVGGGRVKAQVVAPVPWFPFTGARFGRFAEFARVPASESRRGLDVRHPRYFTVPVLGSYLAPFAMALGARSTIARMMRDGTRFDAIDAHYFFPDGVAAALLGSWFRLPVVITARGSDVMEIGRSRIPRAMIRWAARRADAIVTVAAALRDELIRLGVDREKVVVLRNGVDLQAFRPIERREARQRLGLDPEGRVIAAVGRLHEVKAQHLIVEAMTALPDFTLMLAGDGPLRQVLAALADRLGVASRVHFLGNAAQADLPVIYSAADVMVLSSKREGWANVLLEAMACGTPVVATDSGGSAEVVTAPQAGMLIETNSSRAIVDAVQRVVDAPPSRDAVRAYAEQFSWDETTRGQERIFEALSMGSTRLSLQAVARH